MPMAEGREAMLSGRASIDRLTALLISQLRDDPLCNCSIDHCATAA
jgi:hypothetical protein